MFLFGIKQNLIPLYHPQANPAERKNRDLKTQLRTSRSAITKETFVTLYLLKFVTSLQEVRDQVEKQQDLRKEYADASRRPSPSFQIGDLVLLNTHTLIDASKGCTRKLMPLRAGSYIIKRVVSPTTYEVVDSQRQVLGRLHTFLPARRGDCQLDPV